MRYVGWAPAIITLKDGEKVHNYFPVTEHFEGRWSILHVAVVHIPPNLARTDAAEKIEIQYGDTTYTIVVGIQELRIPLLQKPCIEEK